MRSRIVAVLVAAVLIATVAPTWAAFDGGSESTECNGDGTVTWSPRRVWPPNHKNTPITISYDDSENDGDTLTLTVQSITHDEEGLEKGSTARREPDWSGEGNTDTGIDTVPPAAPDPAVVTATVRKERLAKPRDGRTYSITVECVDGGESDGGSTTDTAVVLVTVPHSRGQA